MTSTVTTARRASKRQRESRRRHPRFPCGPCTFGLLAAGRDTPLELVGVHNLSQSGAGLVLNRFIEPGSVVLLNLFNWRRNIATRVPFRIVHASQHEDGTFFVGGAFTEELSAEEVQWLR
jgi:hypothetical protein